MDTKKETHTEERLLAAARNVFERRGFFGARMQDIADEAGINKAMLHYYFRSKEKLFKKIMEEALQKLFSKIESILISASSLEAIVKSFVCGYIDFLTENPYLPSFVIHELNNNPDAMKSLLDEYLPSLYDDFKCAFPELAKGGLYAETDPRHFIVNILSLCIFPFVAKPLLMHKLNFSEEGFSKFIEDRKKLLPVLIMSYPAASSGVSI